MLIIVSFRFILALSAGLRMHKFCHFQKNKTTPPKDKYVGFDSKLQLVGRFQLWGVWSISLLPLLPSPHWSRMFMESSHGVMAKVLDCGLKVNKFRLQSCCYIYFQTNTVRKGMNSLFSQLWVNSITAVLLWH